MAESIENKVINLIKVAEDRYYRLLLMVGESGSGKTSAIQNLANQHKTASININFCLSEALLNLTERQRKLELPEILRRTIESRGNKAFLDNIEILFDADLDQNPLLLLQRLSRNLTIVASWNGKFENGKLTYADLGHREYKSYDITDTTDVLIVSMSGETNLDFNTETGIS